MCSLCRLPVANNHNCGQILTFWGLLYQPPFTDEDQIWCAIADPWCTLTNSVTLCWQKTPNFCRFFRLRHLVLLPVGSSLGKLNMGAQLQTFPYPTASKSFLYSNAFMAKSGAQSLTFKSMINRQTKKIKLFRPPWQRVKSELHQTWHGDRGQDLEHVLALQKLFRVRHIVSPLGGTQNLG